MPSVILLSNVLGAFVVAVVVITQSIVTFALLSS